jgi:CheY-like chemotaxis protein
MNSLKVLIVDDDAPFVELLKLAVRHFNFQLDVAKDGPSAIALLNKKRFDLVISDYRLPGMDGLNLVRIARNQNPDCRIMLVSAANENMISAEIKNLPHFAFIQKPLSPYQIRQAVKTALKK